jgi:hypothetical protein
MADSPVAGWFGTERARGGSAMGWQAEEQQVAGWELAMRGPQGSGGLITERPGGAAQRQLRSRTGQPPANQSRQPRRPDCTRITAATL